VLELLQPTFRIGHIWQAEEFLTTNPKETIAKFDRAFAAFPNAWITREPHEDFKERVPDAIGLIRTGDPTAYGNIIVQSA